MAIPFKTLKIIRIILILIPFILFLFLLNKSLVPKGRLEIDQKSPLISSLEPKDRVRDNVITGEPVYFDIKTAFPFIKAKIEIDYESNLQIYLGGLVNPEKWQYRLYPLKGKEIELNLKNFYFQKGKYRFMISAPGLENYPEGVKIKKIKIILTKNPFSLRNLFKI